MKLKKVFLMCGPSGAGKSTWVSRQLLKANGNAIHISRDAVRFEILKPGEDYFAHENEVFDRFCQLAQAAIGGEPEFIFIDATHLSEKARNKTLDRLNLQNVELHAVSFEVPLDVCLTQNENRTGLARVPKSVIRRMFYSYTPPAETGEKYNYHVIRITAN